MKSRHLLILVLFTLLLSCKTTYRKIFSMVLNKFPTANAPINSDFQTWNNSNIYILRVELNHINKVENKKNNDPITELTDYPLKDYNLLTQPDWKNENVVEEVYLYLSNFEKEVDSGSVLYMSSIPLKSHVSKLIFCNTSFISTYGVNHIMDGTWTKEGDNIELKLEDEKNGLTLKGTKYNNSGNIMIEFTDVNHPKSMEDNDDRFIQIRDIFEVDPNKESSCNDKINGIRFFQNMKRTFVHPNWCELGENFNYNSTMMYYSENLEKRKITKVMIERNDNHDVYFEINNSDSQTSRKNIIRYRR